jgi:hypothetical protein
MASLRNYSPRLLLATLFVLMLGLAGVIEFTGSNIAQRLLVVFIPLGAVALGVTSAMETDSNLELGFALILIGSGTVATGLAVIGAGPFSNRLVDVAIIGSIVGTKFSQPLQSTIQTAQRVVS